MSAPGLEALAAALERAMSAAGPVAMNLICRVSDEG